MRGEGEGGREAWRFREVGEGVDSGRIRVVYGGTGFGRLEALSYVRTRSRTRHTTSFESIKPRSSSEHHKTTHLVSIPKIRHIKHIITSISDTFHNQAHHFHTTQSSHSALFQTAHIHS